MINKVLKARDWNHGKLHDWNHEKIYLSATFLYTFQLSMLKHLQKATQLRWEIVVKKLRKKENLKCEATNLITNILFKVF